MAKKDDSLTQCNDPDLSALAPIVARRVLLQLLEKQPELKNAITALAIEALENPGLEDLTAEIEAEISRVSAGDVYMISGRKWDGYKEPDEAASELLTAVMEPYFDRLEKLLQGKNDAQAQVLCEAIICALYNAQHGDNFPELEEIVEEILQGSADWAARLWRTAGNVQSAGGRRFHPDRTISVDFVTKYVPEWDWLLSED